MLTPTHLSEAMRMVGRSLFVKKHSTFKYPGTAEEICRKIISDCWNKRHNYLQASNGHFCEFYTRDFGFCTEALMKLGYEDKVHATLKYALSRFSRKGRITTAITPDGKPFDFPYQAVESLPFIVHSLRLAGAKDLLDQFSGLLANDIKRYFEEIFDRKTCLVRADRHFSSMRDYAKRRSATYDNCMLAMLKDDLEQLNFYNPFHDYDIKAAIKQNLWNEKYFYDDLRKENIVTGDANVFPFWTGVFNSRSKFKSCLEAMQRAKLDRPFPLRYSSRHASNLIFLDNFVSGYEDTTVWTHLGMCFLDVIKELRKSELRPYLEQYARIIEQNRNFLEVFDESGKPFQTRFYYSDEGMVWASKYLYLSTNTTPG